MPEENTPPSSSATGQPKLSFLQEWLISSVNPDPDGSRKGRWAKIGWEVYERKALLLAATRDLEQNNVDDPMKLAATDIFVEKAQGFLGDRGRRLYWFGAVTGISAILLLGFAAYFVYTRDPLVLLHTKNSNDRVETSYLAVLLLKSTTAGAFVGAMAYFLVALSKAFLHEATVLFSRRHSLRFGRLFVYLMSNKMSREDLEAIFNWNAEFSTAFKDIQADQVSKSPLSRALDVPSEAIKAIKELGARQGDSGETSPYPHDAK